MFQASWGTSVKQQLEQNLPIKETTFYPTPVYVKEAAGDILQKRKMPRGLTKWMDK